MSINILETRSGDRISVDDNIRQIQIDAESELSDIPADTAPGSWAFLCDLSRFWRKKNDGTWVEVGM